MIVGCPSTQIHYMANFNTHLFIAASASSIGAATLCNANYIDAFDIPWFIFLGTIGGLLPDIDSDNSRPLKILFTSLATLISMLAILAYQEQYKVQHVFIIASGTFFLVRYPILALFKRMTVHRGAFHSILCAVLFTFLTTFTVYYLLNTSIIFAWLSGLFIGFGFIVHLLLDELFSVDLGNAQLKRSFGTAFKLFSIKYLSASMGMLISCALLYLFTPEFPFIINWRP
ncbi:MAG: metal-dependent hydrolase [Methylococcaceae bacterium]|nr:metal-dependent hydrolase [Methylococcaceae bacterium]